MTAEKQGRKPLTLDLTARQATSSILCGKNSSLTGCFPTVNQFLLDHSAQSKIQPTYIRREMEKHKELLKRLYLCFAWSEEKFGEKVSEKNFKWLFKKNKQEVMPFSPTFGPVV